MENKDITIATALADFASMSATASAPQSINVTRPLSNGSNKRDDIDTDVPSISEHCSQRREMSLDASNNPLFSHGIGGKNQKFPVKLMQVIDRDEFNHIISWTADGQSFIIHKPMSLMERDDGNAQPYVISNQKGSGEQPKFKSFLRKLYRWGFLKRYNKADDLTYFHKNFKRGNLALCMGITRLPAILNKSRKDQGRATSPAAFKSNHNVILIGQDQASMLNDDKTNFLSLQNLENVPSPNMASNIMGAGASPIASSATSNQCNISNSLLKSLLERRFAGVPPRNLSQGLLQREASSTLRRRIGSPSNTSSLSHIHSLPSGSTAICTLPQASSLLDRGLGGEEMMHFSSPARTETPESLAMVAEYLLEKHDAKIDSLLKKRKDLLGIIDAQNSLRDHHTSLSYGTSYSPTTSTLQQALQGDSGHLHSLLPSQPSIPGSNYNVYTRGQNSSSSFLRRFDPTLHGGQRNSIAQEEDDCSGHCMIMKIALNGLVERQKKMENELSRRY